MKIAIGNDHAATELKFVIMDYLKELGHEVINFGTDGTDSCNYPEYGEKVGRIVGTELAKDIVKAYLDAEFQGGRHQTRIDMIHEIEKRNA